MGVFTLSEIPSPLLNLKIYSISNLRWPYAISKISTLPKQLSWSKNFLWYIPKVETALHSCEWPGESRDLGNFDPFFSGMLPDETAVFLFIINPSSIKLDCNTHRYVEFSTAKNFRCFRHYSELNGSSDRQNCITGSIYVVFCASREFL